MPAKNNYRSEKYSSLRSSRNNGEEDTFTRYNMEAISKLYTACLQHGASFYSRPNRDGSITVRIYDGEAKYEEILSSREDFDLACEEMIEALYGQETVGQVRRLFLPAPPQKPVDAQKQVKP